MSHPEIAAEQAYIDHAYKALSRTKDDASKIASDVIVAGGGTHQARYERDVFVQLSLERLDQLDVGDHALVFGRMDKSSNGDAERYYLGRVAVASETREPIVVDWRAPVASAFYRATAIEPLDLTNRRHFISEGQRLIDIADETFNGSDTTAMAGPGALELALEARRTGAMRDIISTIQAEQDTIIRAPLRGVLVVQGGPGTGKTAVALHRAAYLLFTHRRTLGRGGVLVAGPNAVFVKYIDSVLPALGESDAALSTIIGLVAYARPTIHESRQAAQIKGDARMAKVLKQALKLRQRPLSKDMAVSFGNSDLTLTAADSRQIVSAVKRMPLSHNDARRHALKLVVRRLWENYTALEMSELGGEALTGLTHQELLTELKGDADLKHIIDLIWPRLTAQEFLSDLFDSAELLAHATNGILNPTERDLLLREAPEYLADAVWTKADIPLLDEASSLLTKDETLKTYGHIVIDEAQDLTPMQLRMIGRRSYNGSMTLVGDLAQATTGKPPSRWSDVLRHLDTERGATFEELTVSYRTPREIMHLAEQVLAKAAPDLKAPKTVRDSGFEPVIEASPDPIQRAVDLAGEHRAEDGTLAIICAEPTVAAMHDALTLRGVAFGNANTDGLRHNVTLISSDLVKGLEFDSTIVVEADEIVAENSLRALFVAITRATKRLYIIGKREFTP